MAETVNVLKGGGGGETSQEERKSFLFHFILLFYFFVMVYYIPIKSYFQITEIFRMAFVQNCRSLPKSSGRLTSTIGNLFFK